MRPTSKMYKSNIKLGNASARRTSRRERWKGVGQDWQGSQRPSRGAKQPPAHRESCKQNGGNDGGAGCK